MILVAIIAACTKKCGGPRSALSRRALRRDSGAVFLPDRFSRRGRRDLGPALARADGVAQAGKKLLFAKVMLPATGMVKLDKICPALFRKPAPLVRNLLQGGELWRIQGRDSKSSARDGIGSSPARAAHTTSHSRHALFCPQHTSNKCKNLFRLRVAKRRQSVNAAS